MTRIKTILNDYRGGDVLDAATRLEALVNDFLLSVKEKSGVSVNIASNLSMATVTYILPEGSEITEVIPPAKEEKAESTEDLFKFNGKR